MDMQAAIASLIEGRDLSRKEMADVMHLIMTGEATQAQIGGFLTGLRIKGETVEEITGAAQVMRELALKVKVSGENQVDIVGTGGDSAGIFNVSTASAIVAAAAGATVAKHGNRSVTSNSGSADLLEEAGIRLDLNVEQIERCIDEVGLGFMFALNHHSAMKHAIGPRKELKVRTVFNILGPLTNPASAPNALLGVFSEQWQLPYAEAMRRLGAKHVIVVHSAEGLDEISLAGPTRIVELKDGEISEYSICPEDVGVQSASLNSLVVEDPAASLALIRAAFAGQAPEAADMIALNAGAALYAAGVAGSLVNGVELAQDVIATGQAAEKFKEWADFTQACKQ
ncbi:MAG: anthranilate phosphoribosyltransferase [Pseudomonadales bacterium]